jgi:hypothetical protein
MKYPLDFQLIGYLTGVLPSCAAEGVQYVFTHVVATLDRYSADSVGHVAHGNVNESPRIGLWLRASRTNGGAICEVELRKFLPDNRTASSGSAPQCAEHLRKVIRLDLPEQYDCNP